MLEFGLARNADRLMTAMKTQARISGTKVCGYWRRDTPLLPKEAMSAALRSEIFGNAQLPKNLEAPSFMSECVTDINPLHAVPYLGHIHVDLLRY